MIAKKDQIISDLCKGIEELFAKNKITKFTGTGNFITNNIIEINNEENKQQNSGKSVLIATGSKIIDISGVKIDEKIIVSSTGALALTKILKTLISNWWWIYWFRAWFCMA